jgi:hypothetical protein
MIQSVLSYIQGEPEPWQLVIQEDGNLIVKASYETFHGTVMELADFWAKNQPEPMT